MHQVQDLFIGEGVRPAMHFASPFFDNGKKFLVGFGLCHLRGQIGRVLFQEGIITLITPVASLPFGTSCSPV